MYKRQVHDGCDIDSDNDGISDLLESGNADAIAADTDGSGVIDNQEAMDAGFTDIDGDGAWDQLGAAPVDTDGDGIADFRDLDSDDDGIADAVEAQPTVGYQSPAIGSDADGDGVVDTFDDPAVEHGGAFDTPEDTDGDGTFDFLDTDSDNDGIDDTTESGLMLTGTDADGDGIDDGVNASYGDPDGDVNDPINDLENSDNDPRDADYRSVELSDKDWDGVADIFDADQDGDGILDSVETPVVTLPEERIRPFADLLQGMGTPPTGDFNDIGPSDISFLWGLPLGSVVAELRDVSLAGTSGNSIVAQDETDPSNGVGRLILTGSVPVEIRLVHGGSLPAGDYDGIQINDGAPVAFTGMIGGDIVNTVIGNRNQVELPVGGTHPGVASVDFEWTTTSRDISWFTNTGTSTVQINLTPILIGVDTDGDGVHDGCDIDSDNDGISDLLESGNQLAIDADTDGSGVIDDQEAMDAGFEDLDGDGVWDQLGSAAPVDTDSDGIADYLDLDSDNDGIADAIEAQPTAGYQSPAIGSDADGDGVVDTFDDPAVEHGGAFNTPEDTDGDGVFDFRDTDSDNDGLSDTAESGLTPGADTDGDGIADNIAPDSYADTDGIINDPSTDLDNEIGDTSEVGYREVVADLVTVKTLSSGDATPDEGDTVTFQITVTNDGNVDATNVSLMDSLPAGITFTGSTTTQGSYDQATGLFDIGTLSVGQTATLMLSGTVDVGQGGNTITNMTTAAMADQPDPSTNGDDLVETITINDAADLVTVKTLASGDANPAEGESVTFQIVVTNDGAAQATNVSLIDQLPTGITYTGDTTTQGSYDEATGLFTIGTLNVGETATLLLTGTVDVGQGGNTITNVTTAATGDQMDLSTAGDDLEEAVTIDNTTDLVTVKTLASGDASPDEGDTVTFQIVVTNAGGAQATNVSLTDLLPAGITFTGSSTTQGSYNTTTGLYSIGTLNVNDTATLTLTGTVDVGEGGNTITNTTTAATGDQTDTSTVGDDLNESIVVNNEADLITVKTLASGDTTPNEGDTVTFAITVTNDGGAQATNVSLIDSLPAGITYTSDTTTQGSYDSATGVFTIGTLNVGESATLMLSGTVDVGEGGNSITNMTTAATSDQDDPSTVGDDLVETVTINDAANLVTVKTLASGDAAPAEGDSVTYQIVVTNQGAAQATNVSLIDQLPTGITYTGDTTTQGSYDVATGLFTIGTLNVGESATLTLTGTVDVGQGGNTITNTTTAATGDQMDPTMAGDDLMEVIVVDNTTDLVTVKTLASGDANPDEGDTVTYQIIVTNNGTAQATNVSLIDQLPPGITYTSDTTTQGSYNAATGLWTIGTLNDGDSATITLSGTVDVGQGGNTIINTTTAATGDQNDPSTVGDDLVEEIEVNNEADLVTVKTLTSGNSNPTEGETVTFQIEVTNNGAAQATNVSLTDQLPAGITLTDATTSQGSYNAATGLFTIGTLNVNDTATLTLTGTVDVGQGGNTITNITSAATGDQDDPTTAGDDLEEAVDVDDDANLVTVKSLDSGDSTPDEGDTVTFTIEVNNAGSAQATNVSLTDLLPPGITFASSSVTQGSYNSATGLYSIGTLNAGDSATLTLTGTVDVGQGGNTITNTTTAAMGDQPDDSTAGDDLDESVTVVADADLVTVKTLASGDNTPAEGDTVSFAIEVNNEGTAQATNVSLIDTLPPGISFVSSSVTQGSYNANTGVFTIGTLAAGDSATLTLTGTVDVGQGGNTITNTTTAAMGDQPDPSTAGDDLEESVDVDGDADLVTVKTLASSDNTPAEGDTVSFEIEVTNEGTAQATNVSLIDSLPAGITFVSSSVTQGIYDANTGLFAIGTLASGDSATLTLTGTVDVGQGGNTLTNITTAAEGDQPDPSTVGDELEESVTVEADADLVTVKSLASGDNTPAEGDTVSFDIEVTNNGSAQATGVSLIDTLPPGISFVSSSVTQGSYNATTGVFTIGTLAANASATLTLTGTVDIGQGGNAITNITTAATGDQPDPSTAGDDLEETVNIEADADLVTVKSLASGDNTPAEGDTVSYDIVVTNNGSAQATGVSLIDNLPPGISFVSSSVTQGSYNATTGLFTIGTLAANATATLTLTGTVDVGQGGNTITNITTAATGDQPDLTRAWPAMIWKKLSPLTLTQIWSRLRRLPVVTTRQPKGTR